MPRPSLRLAACAASLLALSAGQALAQAKPPARKTTALTLNTGGVVPAEQRGMALDHVDLRIKVIPARKAIEGDATLTIQALAPLTKLVLDLDRNLPISLLALDGAPLAASAWSNPEGRLSITLPKPLARGEQIKVRIRYAGIPHEAKRAPWDGGFVWKKTPLGQPWIATAVQGDGCDLFWPCIDQPMGEPKLVDLHIVVPAPLVAPANGVFVSMEEQDGWRTYSWRAKNPNTYAIALNIGPYVELGDTYKSRYGDSFPTRFWHVKGHETEAKALLAEFAPMLDFYESMIGPYPFRDEKMGVVETPHLGMEHQTINAYGNAYAKDVYGYDWLLQHELAHEWFGNQLTNVDWDDMWLHEGLGTYMQPLYSQWLHGDMEYMARLNTQRAALQNKFPVVAGKVMAEDQVYDPKIGPGNDIYYKGSNALHTLRTLIGDDAFFNSIRLVVYGRTDPKPGNFAPRYANTRDFIRAVNDVTGTDYGWFFDVYLYEAALPELLESREGDDLVLRWKAPGAKPFPMPVEVKVGGELITLPMTDGLGRVRVGNAALVILDPASKILRRQPHIEAYQAWKKAKDDADKARAEARKKAEASARTKRKTKA
ncbi:M1 family metallopeptidase [Caulobacter sp. ErkDOM-YI]|uniref:M1 family metallopeptidase n=1 Tax=unclassified Caulobacter TaxID=2648921 RepID=UPI003AF66C2A